MAAAGAWQGRRGKELRPGLEQREAALCRDTRRHAGLPAGARLPPRTRAFRAPWARAEASLGVKARAHGPGNGALGLEELGHGEGSVLGTRPAAPAPRPVPRAAQIPPRASPAAPAPPARPASVSRPVRARSPASSWRHNARAPPTAARTGAGGS